MQNELPISILVRTNLSNSCIITSRKLKKSLVNQITFLKICTFSKCLSFAALAKVTVSFGRYWFKIFDHAAPENAKQDARLNPR